MDGDKSTNWRQLYKEALFEPDPTELLARIAEAYYAMQCRARELWYEGHSVTNEQRELDTASEFLQVLTMVAADEGNDKPPRLIAGQPFGKEDS